jgi:lipoprotein NlpD
MHLRFLGLCAVLSLTGCIDPQVGVRRTGGTAQNRIATVSAPGEHRVQKGETLYAIAFKYAVDFRDIARWNGIVEPYTIYPSQRLKMRDPTMQPILEASAPGNTRTAPTPAGVVVETIPATAAGTTQTLNLEASVDASSGVTVGVIAEPTPVTSAQPLNADNSPSDSQGLPTGFSDTPPTASNGTVPAATSLADQAARQTSLAEQAARQTSLADQAARQTSLADQAARQTSLADQAARQTSLAEQAARQTTVPISNVPSATAVKPSVVPVTAEAEIVAPPIAATASIGASGVKPLSGRNGWGWPVQGKLIGTFASADPARQGIDIAGIFGDSVYSANAGEVVYSGRGIIGYGELIVIKHDDATLTAYGHNRKRLVKEGQRIRQGERIAEMGKDPQGRALLHFELRRNGKPIDPLGVLPARAR